MKNLLLIFLLANILYFMWASFTEEEPQTGVAIVEEDDLGPPLEVSAESESVASVGAVLGSGEPSALDAVVGRSCVTIGPIRNVDDADTAILEYANEGMRTARRQTDAEVFIGHWVQIRDVANETTANEMLATLSDGGLGDAYYVETELLISLGLFGDINGAEKIELQARSLDLPAEIVPRTSQAMVYFVDIGLPPGKGAGGIIEKHGEEMVLLREQATCPQ